MLLALQIHNIILIIESFCSCSTRDTRRVNLVDKCMYGPPGIMFYTGLQTNEDFSFVLATLGNAAYKLLVLQK
jgi:hypothetical protein